MAAYQQVQSYLSNHYEGMAPEQLILLLFEGALKSLKLAREGIKEKNIQKKGENLSKAIAIISELNASVDSQMNDESTQFLRSLYTAILEELPKVTLNNDIPTLNTVEGWANLLGPSSIIKPTLSPSVSMTSDADIGSGCPLKFALVRTNGPAVNRIVARINS